MNRIKNVKHQRAVSYAVLVLIPMVIFLSILGVLEKSVKQDVYQADQLVLTTVKKRIGYVLLFHKNDVFKAGI